MAINLSFLDSGNYAAQIYQDGINTDRMASDFQKVTKTLGKNDKLMIRMASGGGFAARLVKK